MTRKEIGSFVGGYLEPLPAPWVVARSALCFLPADYVLRGTHFEVAFRSEPLIYVRPFVSTLFRPSSTFRPAYGDRLLRTDGDRLRPDLWDITREEHRLDLAEALRARGVPSVLDCRSPEELKARIQAHIKHHRRDTSAWEDLGYAWLLCGHQEHSRTCLKHAIYLATHPDWKSWHDQNRLRGRLRQEGFSVKDLPPPKVTSSDVRLADRCELILSLLETDPELATAQLTKWADYTRQANRLSWCDPEPR